MVLSEFGNGWRLSTIFRILQKFYRISCFLSVSDDYQWFSWKRMFPKQFHSIQWFWTAFTQILDFHHSVILRSFFRTFRKKPWNFRLEAFCFDCVVIIWSSFELYEESIAFLLICNISSFLLTSREKWLNFHWISMASKIVDFRKEIKRNRWFLEPRPLRVDPASKIVDFQKEFKGNR